MTRRDIHTPHLTFVVYLFQARIVRIFDRFFQEGNISVFVAMVFHVFKVFVRVLLTYVRSLEKEIYFVEIRV